MSDQQDSSKPEMKARQAPNAEVREEPKLKPGQPANKARPKPAR